MVRKSDSKRNTMKLPAKPDWSFSKCNIHFSKQLLARDNAITKPIFARPSCTEKQHENHNDSKKIRRSNISKNPKNLAIDQNLIDKETAQVTQTDSTSSDKSCPSFEMAAFQKICAKAPEEDAKTKKDSQISIDLSNVDAEDFKKVPKPYKKKMASFLEKKIESLQKELKNKLNSQRLTTQSDSPAFSQSPSQIMVKFGSKQNAWFSKNSMAMNVKKRKYRNPKAKIKQAKERMSEKENSRERISRNVVFSKVASELSTSAESRDTRICDIYDLQNIPSDILDMLVCEDRENCSHDHSQYRLVNGKIYTTASFSNTTPSCISSQKRSSRSLKPNCRGSGDFNCKRFSIYQRRIPYCSLSRNTESSSKETSGMRKPPVVPPPPVGYHVRKDYSDSDSSGQILNECRSNSLSDAEEFDKSVALVKSISLVRIPKQGKEIDNSKYNLKSVQGVISEVSTQIPFEIPNKQAPKRSKIHPRIDYHPSIRKNYCPSTKTERERMMPSSDFDMVEINIQSREGKDRYDFNGIHKVKHGRWGFDTSTVSASPSPALDINNNALPNETWVEGNETGSSPCKGSLTSVHSSEQFFSMQTDISDARSGDEWVPDARSLESFLDLGQQTVSDELSQATVLSQLPGLEPNENDSAKNTIHQPSAEEIIPCEPSGDKSLSEKCPTHRDDVSKVPKNTASDLQNVEENIGKKKAIYLEFESSVIKKVATTTTIKESKKPQSEKLKSVFVAGNEIHEGVLGSTQKTEKTSVSPLPRLTKIVRVGESVDAGFYKADNQKQNRNSDTTLEALQYMNIRKKKVVYGRLNSCKEFRPGPESLHRCEISRSDESTTGNSVNLSVLKEAPKSSKNIISENAPSKTNEEFSKENKVSNAKEMLVKSGGSTDKPVTEEYLILKESKETNADAKKGKALDETLEKEIIISHALKSDSATFHKSATSKPSRKRSQSLNSHQHGRKDTSKKKTTSILSFETKLGAPHMRVNTSKSSRKKGPSRQKIPSVSPKLKRVRGKRPAGEVGGTTSKRKQKSSKGIKRSSDKRKKKSQRKTEEEEETYESTSTNVKRSTSESVSAEENVTDKEDEKGVVTEDSDTSTLKVGNDLPNQSRSSSATRRSRGKRLPSHKGKSTTETNKSTSIKEKQSPERSHRFPHSPKLRAGKSSGNIARKGFSLNVSGGDNESDRMSRLATNFKLKQTKDLVQAERGWNSSPSLNEKLNVSPKRSLQKRTKLKYQIVKADLPKAEPALDPIIQFTENEENNPFSKLGLSASDTKLSSQYLDVPIEKNSSNQGKSVQFSESTEEHIRTITDEVSDWEMDSPKSEELVKPATDHGWEDRLPKKNEELMGILNEPYTASEQKITHCRTKQRSRPMWLKKAPKSPEATDNEKTDKVEEAKINLLKRRNFSAENLLKKKKREIFENLLKPKKCNIQVSIPLPGPSDGPQNAGQPLKKTKVAYSSMLNNILSSIPFKGAERKVIAKVGTPVDIKEITEGSSVDANDYAKALRFSPKVKKGAKPLSMETKRNSTQETEKKGIKIQPAMKKSALQDSTSHWSLSSNESNVDAEQELGSRFSHSTDIDETFGIKSKTIPYHPRKIERRFAHKKRATTENVESLRVGHTLSGRRPSATNIAVHGDLMEMDVLNFGLTWALHNFLQRLPFFNSQSCEPETAASGDISINRLHRQVVE